MEGWGGLSGPETGAADDGGTASRTPEQHVEVLVRQRDMLMREVTALGNKVAGLDMAIKILSE